MHFERKEAKVQLFLTRLVTFMRNTVGRILCFYLVDRLFSFRLCFSDIVLCVGSGEKGQRGRESAYVFCVFPSVQ